MWASSLMYIFMDLVVLSGVFVETLMKIYLFCLEP